MKEEIFINLSGIYDGFPTELNCKDIEGTNCYCDDLAAGELRRRLKGVSPRGLHFIDSGNYHYLSYFFLEKIKEDFSLVLLDHHPDYQPPSFGNILSCGGWVKNAFEDFEQLKRIYMVDVDKKLLNELEDIPEEIIYLEKDEIHKIPGEYPLYISLDKDVLSPREAATDWDQGDMKTIQLLTILEKLCRYKILGIDVCGEKKENPKDEEIEKNRKINDKIRNCLDNNMLLC